MKRRHALNRWFMTEEVYPHRPFSISEDLARLPQVPSSTKLDLAGVYGFTNRVLVDGPRRVHNGALLVKQLAEDVGQTDYNKLWMSLQDAVLLSDIYCIDTPELYQMQSCPLVWSISFAEAVETLPRIIMPVPALQFRQYIHADDELFMFIVLLNHADFVGTLTPLQAARAMASFLRLPLPRCRTAMRLLYDLGFIDVGPDDKVVLRDTPQRSTTPLLPWVSDWSSAYRQYRRIDPDENTNTKEKLASLSVERFNPLDYLRTDAVD